MENPQQHHCYIYIFSTLGYKSQLAGNIGRGVLDINPLSNNEITILELSSYQIEVARTLSPDIAIFTNFSADHLERHGAWRVPCC